MEEREVTVDYMLDLCKKLSESGYGDMTFKFSDGKLHTDELGCNYITREVTLRGHLFHDSIVKNMREFMNTVESAKEKFYQNMSIINKEK